MRGCGLFLFVAMNFFWGPSTFAFSCRDLMTKRDNSADARMLLSLSQPLATNGRVSLYAIKKQGVVQDKQSDMVERLEKSLWFQYGVKLQAQDSLLVLNAQGDRGKVFERIVLGELNSLTLNMVGVDAFIINYKVSDRAMGRSRLLVVVKEKVRDYRELGESSSHPEIVDRLSESLHETLVNVINESTFSFYGEREAHFESAYQALSLRPPGGRFGNESRMTRSEFLSSYHRAYAVLMTSIPPEDLFYMRPSFWQSHPVADRFILDVFQRTFQKSSSQFALDFGEKVNRLKERLYFLIHRDRIEAGRGQGLSPDPDVHANIFSVSSGQGSHVLHSEADQYEQGYDFFGSWSSQNISLSEWGDGIQSRLSPDTISRLEQMGLRQLSDLKYKSAEILMSEGHLTISDISVLARELLEYGVYLRYDWSVYRQLPRDLRLAIKPPHRPNFMYNPQTNQYYPINGQTERSGKPR